MTTPFPIVCASGDWLNEKKVEIDRSTIVVVPVWVLNDLIKRHKEYEKDDRLLGHRTSANVHRGNWEMIELIATDEAFLERGRDMLKELIVAQRKTPCNHIWMDMTLKEDADNHVTRKMCHRCFEVVVEGNLEGEPLSYTVPKEGGVK